MVNVTDFLIFKLSLLFLILIFIIVAKDFIISDNLKMFYADFQKIEIFFLAVFFI